MARASIVGWAHAPFGKLDDPGVESSIARVAGETLAHSDVGPEDVGGICAGLAGVFRVDGAAVANDVSVLERRK